MSEQPSDHEDLRQAYVQASDNFATARESYRVALDALREAGVEPGDPPEDPADRPVEAPEVVLQALVEQAGFTPEQAIEVLSNVEPEPQVAQVEGVESEAKGMGG